MTKIFHVNWFRQDKNGAFIWPGFGDNPRVLRWVLNRCQGKGQAVESPIGSLPAPGAIDTAGLDISQDTMKALCSNDHHHWHDEIFPDSALREQLCTFFRATLADKPNT